MADVGAAGGAGAVRCDQCEHDVPALQFCVRCGHSLAQEKERADGGRRRQQFAAAPEESANAVSVFSTLFPQLPRADMNVFRVAFAVGVVVIVGLALARLFPLALIAATVLVPLLMVIYLYDVDVYEDEPIRVIALTMLWGAVTGVMFGFAIRALLPVDAVTRLDAGQFAVRGVVLPLANAAVMLLGPLFLLRYRKFNDVLDGATFGAASAVTFVGAQVLAQAVDVLGGGLQPVGDPLPWVVRLLTLGLAMPIIAAGFIGAATASFWLRYRAPVEDRNALGIIGQPAVAVAIAALALVGAAVAQLVLGRYTGVGVLAALALVGVIWLRRVIHLGLLQESREIEIAAPIACPNCAYSTPYHSFCGNCGISLRALPKDARGTRGPGTTQAAGGRP